MTKLKEPNARSAYLALGPGWSLAKLPGKFGEQSGRAPAMSTLEKWSSERGWVKLARDHDELVAREIAKNVAKNQAQRGADLVAHLIAAAEEGLIRATAAARVETKFRNLIEGAVTALMAADVLAGGASDRTEQQERLRLERSQAALRNMEKVLGLTGDPAKDTGRGGPPVP